MTLSFSFLFSHSQKRSRSFRSKISDILKLCFPLPIFLMNHRRKNASMFLEDVRRATLMPKVTAQSGAKSIVLRADS